MSRAVRPPHRRRRRAWAPRAAGRCRRRLGCIQVAASAVGLPYRSRALSIGSPSGFGPYVGPRSRSSGSSVGRPGRCRALRWPLAACGRSTAARPPSREGRAWSADTPSRSGSSAVLPPPPRRPSLRPSLASGRLDQVDLRLLHVEGMDSAFRQRHRDRAPCLRGVPRKAFAVEEAWRRLPADARADCRHRRPQHLEGAAGRHPKRSARCRRCAGSGRGARGSRRRLRSSPRRRRVSHRAAMRDPKGRCRPVPVLHLRGIERVGCTWVSSALSRWMGPRRSFRSNVLEHRDGHLPGIPSWGCALADVAMAHRTRPGSARPSQTCLSMSTAASQRPRHRLVGAASDN